MEPLFVWISHYGYFAIFSLLMLGIVGLPVPDETLLVFSGYLVYAGRLHPLLTIAAAFLGSACGITVSYLLGRTLGIGLIHRYGRAIRITEDKLNRVHEWFERVGRWALVIGYYMPGVRHFTAVIAGTSGLEAPVFASYAYSGAFLWVMSFLSLGYFLGEQWHRVAEKVQHALLIATGIVVLLLLLCSLVAQLRKKLR